MDQQVEQAPVGGDVTVTREEYGRVGTSRRLPRQEQHTIIGQDNVLQPPSRNAGKRCVQVAKLGWKHATIQPPMLLQGDGEVPINLQSIVKL